MCPDADDAEGLAAGADLAGLEEEVHTAGRPAVAGCAVAETAVPALPLVEALEEGV